MTEVIGVRFKKVGKVYYFDPGGTSVRRGDRVIVETARGVECGEAVVANREVEDKSIVKPLKRLVRLATAADLKTLEQNGRFEEEAFKVCEQKIAQHKLEMKLVSVEYTFDHSKILFYFSAEGRVDFRELVKDLAGIFRTRIELRQIGVRDEAKMIGGLGICGCPLCCATFLDDFQPVSINMAKDQGLSLNPTKISGTCGRLMCCLKYENEAYQDMIARTPPVDSLVTTPQGRGSVMSVSLLKGTCKVRLQNNPDSPVTMSCEECKLLRAGRDRRRDDESEGDAPRRENRNGGRGNRQDNGPEAAPPADSTSDDSTTGGAAEPAAPSAPQRQGGDGKPGRQREGNRPRRRRRPEGGSGGNNPQEKNNNTNK